MNRFMRRIQRATAISLFLLNFTGARAIAVTSPCERGRMFFGPSLAFKAIIKTISKRESKRSGQRSLGQARKSSTSRDMESMKRALSLTDVTIFPATTVALESPRLQSNPLYAVKLPTDHSPTQPTHLHSKK